MNADIMDKMAELEALKKQAIQIELDTIRVANENLKQLGYKRPRLKKGETLAQAQARTTTVKKQQKAA